MKPGSAGSAEDRTLVVGLVVDPGLAAEIAEHVAEDLPEALSQQVSNRVTWNVCVCSEALPLDEHDDIPMVELARERMPREGWDLMIYLTDLPRRVGTRPIVSDLSSTHGVALVSLPAVGWVRLRPHVRETIVYLVYEMAGHELGIGQSDGESGRAFRRRPTELVSPLRHVPSTDHDIDLHLTLAGIRGKARLMFGMVRNNRPWRLVPQLAGAVAAAAAAAAFGVFYGSIWTIADALSPARLAVINVFAVAIMVIWLIVYNNLWERPAGRVDREKVVLYNAATVLTVSLGVWFAYVLLFAITLAAAGVVISAELLQTRLGHPVSWVNYAIIAWMSSSLGAVAGALGSTFESDEAVHQATYSSREQERRTRQRE